MYSCSNTNKNTVLAKTFLKCAKRLGMNLDQIAATISTAPEKLSLNTFIIRPNSKQGTLALSLIRITISLETLNGGDVEMIRHFMYQKNHLTGGIPIEQVQHPQGLLKVLSFVEAIQVKI